MKLFRVDGQVRSQRFWGEGRVRGLNAEYTLHVGAASVEEAIEKFKVAMKIRLERADEDDEGPYTQTVTNSVITDVTTVSIIDLV